MLNTFIQMMASINDPVAIERGYQILAAKRDLLAENSGKGEAIAMQASRIDGRNYTLLPVQQKGRTTPRHKEEFKLMPSFDEVYITAYIKGEWLLEITLPSWGMHALRLTKGSHWRMFDAGYEYSSVEEVKTGRKVRIRNKYLKSVFVPA